MKQSLLFLSFYFLYFSDQLTAQNLVPNPNFELVAKMPSKQNPGIDCAKQWRTPTFTGSDYYHADAEKCNGTPKNRFGNQTPF